MAEAETYVLGPESAAWLKNQMGRGPDLIDPRPSRGGARGKHPLIVRCTSITAASGSGVGAQCYPAVVVEQDATATTQPNLGNVWLTLLTNESTPAVPTDEALYSVLMAGDFDPGADNRPRVFGVAPAVGGSGIDVEDTDESPTVATVTQLRFDSADGFVVSTPGAGIARVDMLAASTTQVGVLNNATQTVDGLKVFQGGARSFGGTGSAGFLAHNAGFIGSGYPGGYGAVSASYTPDGYASDYLFVSDDTGNVTSLIGSGFTAAETAEEVWMLPIYSDAAQFDYRGVLVMVGHYGVYWPSDGKVYTGATGTGPGGLEVKNGIVTSIGAPTGTYTPSNVTTDRSYDANSTTLDEIADVLGTLIADLQAQNIIG